jgi:murein DD-endopeptidase MepM/ murein hydrolase activator NlpD
MRVYGPVEGRGRTNLDNSRARDSYKPQSGAIDLGNEPPLFVDGGSSADFDRSRVSVRWLSGTILTGLCGAALMGGAVFAALGDAKFAADPERIEPAMRSGAASRSTVRKSDRLPPVTEGTGARQVIPITEMIKVGEREVPRVKRLARISSNLALSTTELTSNLPRFNPQRALANADSDTVAAAQRPDAAAPDAEVSFVTRDLASAMPRLRVAAVAPMEDVMRKVREAANWTGEQSAPKYVLARATPGDLPYGASDLPPDIYAPFEARITEENITQLPKTAAQATGGNPGNERTVTIKKGDTLGAILRDNSGAIPEEIKAVYAVLGDRARDGNLKEGQKLRILLSPVRGTQRLQPVRVMVVGDQNSVEAVVALSDMNRYVSVDVQMAEASTTAQDDDDDDDGSGVRLYQSIYETALRNRVPRGVIDELIRVYSYDVDFQRKARPGDSLEVLFAGDEQNADPKAEVMFASLTVGDETKKYYRYISPDDGVVDYYDETGKSAKKFLVRKPVTEAIMRSGFGSRKHPILGYTKMHTGVDWAAPLGTPIYAAGNGEIEKAGWESGYGKYIRIKHNYGYETAYGHMTAFARGIDPGVKVHQGQLIGYVGSTGLSTGPHVHYEIIVNGRMVDPMRIKLPRGRVLEGAVLATFERERDKVNGYMGQQQTRTAQAALAR